MNIKVSPNQYNELVDMLAKRDRVKFTKFLRDKDGSLDLLSIKILIDKMSYELGIMEEAPTVQPPVEINIIEEGIRPSILHCVVDVRIDNKDDAITVSTTGDTVCFELYDHTLVVDVNRLRDILRSVEAFNSIGTLS
jgi:hypothetical protein